ncbi:MAG: proprotein convertase P-domain-containing protein [Fuerstiella sp.]
MEVNNDEFGLVRLDLRTGEVIRFGSVETGFRLFSNNRFQDMLVEVDPGTGAIVNEIPVPAGVAGTDGGLAFDGTTLWALDTESDTIYGLNPDTGELISTHALNLVSATGVLASGFTGLAALNDLLYVLDAGNDNTIYGYNPVGQTPAGSFQVGVGGSGQGIVLDGGLAAITGPDGLLAADLLTDQVYLINAVTGEIINTINTGITRKTGLASADGEIFVGDFDSEDILVFSRDGQALRTLDVNSAQVAFGSLALGGDDVPGTIRTDNRFIDVTVGLDDVVYGLSGNQTTVRRYSTTTLALIETINLAASIRTITVDEQGFIYGGDDNGDVFVFNPDGSVLRTASSSVAGLADIQINVSHEILFSDVFGQTSTTDSDFTSFVQLETAGGTSFVSFARHQSQPSGDLIVSLQFNNPGELDVPATVTIPVNQQSVTVSIDVLDDNERDGTQFVTINASAPSYEFGATTVSVTDVETVGVDVIPDTVVEGAGEIADAVRVFRTDVDGPLDFVSSEVGAVTTAMPILDNDVSLSRITVAPQISRVMDVNVTVSFVHEAIPDLDVYLFSPSGTRVELFTDLNSNASNLTNTTFDDEAGQRIIEGVAPYTGRFVGEGFLDKFDGENPSGDWILEIVDDNKTDSGTLVSWSLELTTIGLSSTQVTLSSSDTTEAVVTTTVMIPANQAEVRIPLESIDDLLLDGTQTAVISVVAASLSGLELGSDVVDVTDNEELMIVLDKTLITEGDGPGAIRGTITRSDAGGNSDLVVSLLSSDTSEISVPASVTIPAGETSVSFDVDAVDDLLFDGTQVVTFTASSPGYLTTTSPEISVTDQEARLHLTTLSDNVAEDAGFLTITLARLDVNDLTVAQSVVLSSSDETELTVPALVVIPSGAVLTTFTATILGDAILDGSQVVTITAADANTANPTIDTATKDITVDDAESLSVTVPAGSERILENAGAGAALATVSISTSGHTSPIVVNLSNSDLSEASIPQQVVIPVGATSATFLIDAVNDDFIDRDQSVLISADSAGYRTGVLDLTVADHEPPILAGPAFETEDPTPALIWSPVDGATRYDLWLNDVSRNIIQMFRMDNILAPAPLFLSNFQGGPFNIVVDGVPQTLPFDPALWDQSTVPVATQDVAADNLATNAAAGIVSAHLDEAPNGFDRLQSVSMDISGELGAQLKYTFQRNTPPTLIDPNAPAIPTLQLVLSYRNAVGEWVQLERQFPDQVALDGFIRSKVQLPADALHSDFAFRFETIGGGAGAEDDWFIGEVELAGYPNVIPDQQIGVGRYRFWVRAYDDLEQSGFWSQGRDFRVLTRPEITSPASQSVSASNSFPEISWTTVVDTDHYELWVNNVTTGEIQAIYETNLQTTSFASAAANLPGGTYEAWTRAIGPDGLAGFWSNSVTFTVLSAPQNVTPTGATFDRTPEIRWGSVVGASHYYVWLTLRNPGEVAVPVLIDQYVTGTTRVPNTDLADGNYVVWVQAISEDDTRSAWSTGVEFTIGGRPEILTPTESGTTSSTPTFLWAGITGAEKYEIWINRIDVPQTQVVHDTNVTVASFTVQTPLVAGEYRVWVRAISEMGEKSFWSKPVNFTVAVLPSRSNSGSALPDDLLLPGDVSDPVIQLTVSEHVSAVASDTAESAALNSQTAVTALTLEATAGPAADGDEAVEDLDSVMSDWAAADWWSGTTSEEKDSKDSTPAVAALGLGILATQPMLKKTVGKKRNRV